MTLKYFLITFIPAIVCFHDGVAQENQAQKYLTLVKKVSLDGITGTEFSMAVNLKDTVLYLASANNNTIQVINLRSGEHLLTIFGIPRLANICYIDKQDEIVATSETTKCFFYSSRSFARISKINMMSPSNSIVYDDRSNNIYIGYEEGIKRVDAIAHKITGFIPLYTEPSRLAFDATTNRLYVHFFKAYKTTVIDVTVFKKVIEWESDYPLLDALTIDTSKQRVFLVSRKPSQLIVTNEITGKKENIILSVNGIKNIHFDHHARRLYLIGEQTVMICQDNAIGFKNLCEIKTETPVINSFYEARLGLLILATKAPSKNGCELLLYRTISQ